jgi:hypothetical protein
MPTKWLKLSRHSDVKKPWAGTRPSVDPDDEACQPSPKKEIFQGLVERAGVLSIIINYDYDSTLD